MKRQFFYPGMVAIMFVFASLDVHAQADEPSKSLKEARSQIEKMNTKRVDAMEKGDYTASLSMYAEDAYSLPSYSPMVKGMKAIKKSTEEMANSPMKINSFDMETKEIIAGGDLFVEIGTYDMKMEIEGMPEPINDQGKYVTVWENQEDGSIKIKVETWNSNSNPMEHQGGS